MSGEERNGVCQTGVIRSHGSLIPKIKRLKIATEKDFQEFREFLKEDYPGFVLKSDKKNVKVWAKLVEGSPLRLFKVN